MKTGRIADSPAKSLLWKCRCFIESDETEIAIDLFIQIGELWRAGFGRSSRHFLAHFRRTEQSRAAQLARVGRVSVEDVPADSTAERSGPGDVSGFAPEIRQTGLRDLAK